MRLLVWLWEMQRMTDERKKELEELQDYLIEQYAEIEAHTEYIRGLLGGRFADEK